MMNEFAVIGCDGSFCQDSDTQEAFTLDDANIAFCRVCWSREMQRRRSSGGEVLPFPGGTVSCNSVVAYPYSNPASRGTHATGAHGNSGVEKIRRTRPVLYEEE